MGEQCYTGNARPKCKLMDETQEYLQKLQEEIIAEEILYRCVQNMMEIQKQCLNHK